MAKATTVKKITDALKEIGRTDAEIELLRETVNAALMLEKQLAALRTELESEGATDEEGRESGKMRCYESLFKTYKSAVELLIGGRVKDKPAPKADRPAATVLEMVRGRHRA